MKHPSLPVKRQSVKKGALRTLFVNVARKRHRASTSLPPMPETVGDVPNVGVARALVVILAIHIIAIAGIFIHSHFFEKSGDGSSAKLSVATPGREEKPLPKMAADTPRHVILTGESYASIAQLHDVDVKQLQEMNNGVELRAGNFLALPSKKIAAVEPPELAAVRAGDPVGSMNTTVMTSPPPVATDVIREAPMVEAKPPRAILVKPSRQSEAETMSSNRSGKEKPEKSVASSSKQASETKQAAANKAAAAPKVAATTPPSRKGGKITVKSGDTLWSLAKANGTTPAALMKANGVKDASKLKTGMVLSIP